MIERWGVDVYLWVEYGYTLGIWDDFLGMLGVYYWGL
jgi:hypothetical protein